MRFNLANILDLGIDFATSNLLRFDVLSLALRPCKTLVNEYSDNLPMQGIGKNERGRYKVEQICA